MSILKNVTKTKYGLGGNTPENLPGSSNRSQVHVQGAKALRVDPEASAFDLDGRSPEQRYTSALPK